MAVDGVEQPEIGDVGGRKVGQGLILLAAAAGKLAAARHQQLDHIAEDAFQGGVRVNVDEGRNVSWVDLVDAGLGAENAHEAKNDRSLAVLALGKNLKVLARHLDGLFTASGILVADHQQLSQEAGADLPAIH